MLRRATEADLEPLTALWRAGYGGTAASAAGWLQNIVGLENIFLLEDAAGNGAAPAAMIGAAPVGCGHRRGVWLCAMTTRRDLRGQGIMTRLLEASTRAFAAGGYDFAVALPESARAAKRLESMAFSAAFPLRVVKKAIDHNLWAQAEFDNMTVRRLMETRLRYQPACVTVPERSMNEMVSRLYRRGVTIVSNRRGYGLYYVKDGVLQFVELQADNDHSADVLLQAAREKTGAEGAQILLAGNQTLYLGEGRRCGYGMIRFLGEPFPTTDVYFRLLL